MRKGGMMTRTTTKLGTMNVAATVAGLLATSTLSSVASADPGAAEALFQQARTLMDAGKTDQACPKFADSYKLDPAPGTLLNIAECSRIAGKTATAWGQFVEAARDFRRKNDERRAKFADDRAAALKPKLASIVLKAESPASGMVIKRDGAEQSSASLNEKLPIDPGSHAIVAEAPGKKKHEQTVQIAEGATVTVVIPALEDAPPEEPKPGVGTGEGVGDGADPARGRTQRIAGFVVGGVGLASLGVGAAFVGLTASQSSDVESLCPDQRCSTAEGRDALDTGMLYANLANGLLIAGGVVAATGLVVVLTAPSSEADVALELRPGGLGLHGTF